MGCKILDSGDWMLGAGDWILDAGCWILDTRCWILDAGSCTIKKLVSSIKYLDKKKSRYKNGT